MIPYCLHFSIGTSISWLKNREYLRVLENYLPFVDVPFELVQSRDGLMVHLQDVAGSSGKYPSCDVTLRQQEHSYCLSQFPGFWTWWGWHMSLEKPSTRTVRTCDSFPICNQFYPFDFFYIAFLLFILITMSEIVKTHDLCPTIHVVEPGSAVCGLKDWEAVVLSLSIDFVQPLPPFGIITIFFRTVLSNILVISHLQLFKF